MLREFFFNWIDVDASQGVDNESWNRLVVDGVLTDASELHRLVFYGGVAPHLRKQVRKSFQRINTIITKINEHESNQI